MVSILSFFSKKRPKTTSSSSSDEPRRSTVRPVTPPSPTHRKPQRTRSTRNKAAASFRADATRRASTDSKRKSTTPPPQINIALPFEARASDSFDASLGLDTVGRTPVLAPAERRALDSQRFTPADLQAAWEWLGPEFTQRGAERVGIMLPRRFQASRDRQRHLTALFVLARRPELADNFPSIAGQYAVPKEEGAAEEWKSRLLAVANETPNPVDLAEMLKTILRRLAATSKPIVDPAVYVRFVQQEHAASYPRSSYDTMFINQLDSVVIQLLSAVFEVVAAIALHSESNAMSAGRLCHLFGWWLLGSVPDGTTDWNGLYQAYKLAGQRTEHLFYARLRFQTTQQKMPRRLVQLILSYPFGESSASSEHLPLPPASTFPRKVLHVALGTDSALPTGTDPAKVLGDALIAKLDEDASAPQWVTLRTRDGQSVTLEAVLSEDSQSFLEELSHAKGLELTSPPITPQDESDEKKYHPFSSDSERITTRRRSQSWGDAPRLELSRSGQRPSLGDVAESPTPSNSSKRSLEKQRSEANLCPAEWNNFAVSGFGETSEGVRDLSLSLKKPKTPVRHAAKHAKLVTPVEKKKFRISGGTPSTTFVVASEEVVEIDDAFLQFVEDGQLDPVASSSWPRFALVQLATSLSGPDAEMIDWLLVTVKKREVRRAPSLDEPLPDLRLMESRPSLSTTESHASRFGSGFGLAAAFTKSFRRRSSFLGAYQSQTAPARGKQILGPVAETKPKHQSKDSAISNVPTEYTIGEMGEIVMIPSNLELQEGAAPAKADSVLTRTSATDWIYLAEGGAHVVFRYRGTEPSLQGKVIRLVKVAAVGEPDIALRETWKYKLLPQIVPLTLLAQTTPTPINEQWARGVVTPTEMLRPTARRAETKGPLADVIDYTVPAQLMDDLLGSTPDGKVLAIEIKPKWGFLPSAENVSPAEAASVKSKICRFCLHQHYKGAESSYCPLDLYSGDRMRVRKALDGLWEQWHHSDGEKNNLRVFVDGKKILPSNTEDIPTAGKSLAEGTAEYIIPLLEQSQILDTLKHLQSTLDAHDISTLAEEFSSSHPGAAAFSTDHVSEPTIDELTDFVAAYKANSSWTPRQRQIAYGLSAIFKDCSIIVRSVLRPAGEGFELNTAKSSISIIDTDLKPLTKLSKWHDLDDKLWRHWAQTKVAPVAEATAPVTEVLPVQPIPAEVPAPATPATTSKSLPTEMSSPSTPSKVALAAVGVGAGALAGGLATRHRKVSSSSSIPQVEEANTALRNVVTPSPSKSKVFLPDETPVGAPDVESAKPVEVKPTDEPATAAAVEPSVAVPISEPVTETESVPAPQLTNAASEEAHVLSEAQDSAEVLAGKPSPATVQSEDAAAPVEVSHVEPRVEPVASTDEPTAVEAATPAVEEAAATDPVDSVPAVTESAPVSTTVEELAASQPAADESSSVLPSTQTDEVSSVLPESVDPSAVTGNEVHAASPGQPADVPTLSIPPIGTAATAERQPSSPVVTPTSPTDSNRTSLAVLGVAGAAAGTAAAVANHPRTPSGTSIGPDGKPKKGRLSSLFHRKTSGKGEINPGKTEKIGSPLSSPASSPLTPKSAVPEPKKSPLLEKKTKAEKKAKDTESGFASRFRKNKKAVATGAAAGAGAVVATKALGTGLEKEPTPADELQDPFAKDVVDEQTVVIASSPKKAQEENETAVEDVEAVEDKSIAAEPETTSAIEQTAEPATETTQGAEQPETAIIESEQPAVESQQDVPETLASEIPAEASEITQDSAPTVGADDITTVESTQPAAEETPANVLPSEVEDITQATEAQEDERDVQPDIATSDKPTLTSLELPDDTTRNLNIGSTTLPRLSAFGDDIVSKTPPPLSPLGVADSPTTPAMVPTKAPDSPTDTAFRKADTTFPRLSAFGPPGGSPVNYEKDTAPALPVDVSVASAATPTPEAEEVALPKEESRAVIENHDVAADDAVGDDANVAPAATPATPSSVQAEPPTPAVEKPVEQEVFEDGVAAPTEATTTIVDDSNDANQPQVVVADIAPTAGEKEVDATPENEAAPISTTSEVNAPFAGAALVGGATSAAALVTVASSGDSIMSVADSEASALNDARMKRSSAPSPSPRLSTSALSTEVEPFTADLTGVEEEHEPATTPVVPIVPLAPVEGEHVDEPAASEAHPTIISQPVTEDNLSIAPLPLAPVEDAAASPTIADRRMSAKALAITPGLLDVDEEKPQPISPPAHVEHYQHAELPPLPNPTSGGSNVDPDEGSLTSNNSPFVTAPVTPAVIALDEADKHELVDDISQAYDFPIHSPTPPMMHIASFPNSASNNSLGARSVSAASTGTVSSVMSAQPSTGLNIATPVFVPLAGAEVDEDEKAEDKRDV